MSTNPYIKTPENRRRINLDRGIIQETIFERGNLSGSLNKIQKFSSLYLPPNSEILETYSPYQEIFYIIKGKGTLVSSLIKAEAETEIREGQAILIGARTPYNLLTSESSLEMLSIIKGSFRDSSTESRITIKDTEKIPFDNNTYHWCHRVKTIFDYKKDNLSNLHFVSLVYIDPKKMPEPHVHFPGDDEVWHSLEGETYMALHDNLIEQKPGTSILIPADGKTEHTSINTGDKTAKFFFFLHSKSLENK